MVAELANRGPRLRHPRPGRRQPLDGHAAGAAGHVRHEARAAARRPGRLGDQPARAALNVPERTPGPRPHPGRPALPRRPAPARRRAAAVDDLADGGGRARQARRRTTGRAARARRSGCCPTELPYDGAAACRRPAAGCPIGIAEADLQPVYLDFDAEPHLLLFGDVECGKSSFLRGLAEAITTRPTSRAQARIILVDYRRSLLGCVDTDHLHRLRHLPRRSPRTWSQRSSTVMQERLPGPDVTPEQLRTRNWWHGPRAVPAGRRLRPGGGRGRSTRWRRCWSSCRRGATSACTWWSPAGSAAPAGRCSIR